MNSGLEVGENYYQYYSSRDPHRMHIIVPCPTVGGAKTDAAIHPSVCLSVCPVF